MIRKYKKGDRIILRWSDGTMYDGAFVRYLVNEDTTAIVHLDVHRPNPYSWYCNEEDLRPLFALADFDLQEIS